MAFTQFKHSGTLNPEISVCEKKHSSFAEKAAEEGIVLLKNENILPISLSASVALLMMNFSKSGKTVDESRAWLKRIVITWAILNGLGFIMAYITPFFAGGKWNG